MAASTASGFTGIARMKWQHVSISGARLHNKPTGDHPIPTGKGESPLFITHFNIFII